MVLVSDVSVTVWRPDVMVTADLRQAAHTLVDKDGRTIKRITSEHVYLYVRLSYRGRWWITSIGIDPVNDDGTHRDS